MATAMKFHGCGLRESGEGHVAGGKEEREGLKRLPGTRLCRPCWQNKTYPEMAHRVFEETDQ